MSTTYCAFFSFSKIEDSISGNDELYTFSFPELQIRKQICIFHIVKAVLLYK